MKQQLRVSSLCADRKQAVLLVTLACLVSFTMAAGLACSNDAQCRRNVCINQTCGPRPLDGGACNDASQCLLAGSTCSGTPKVCQLPFIPASPEFGWTGIKAMPGLINFNTVVSVGEKLYSIGGFANQRGRTPFNVFDANTNTWTPIKTVLDEFFPSSAVVIGKSIFVAGASGKAVAGGSATGFFRFDTTTNQWDAPGAWTQIPATLDSFSMVAVGNFVYLFGGANPEGTPVKTIYRFDTTKPLSAWTNPTNFPSGVSELSAAANGNLIYITGGYDSTGQLTTNTWVYDANTPTVAPKPFKPLSAPRQSHMSFIINYKLHILGGISGETPLRSIEVIDLAATTPAWKTLAAKTSFNYRGQIGGLIRNRFFIVGQGLTEVFDPLNTALPHPPLALPPLPSSDPALASVANALVFVGDSDGYGAKDAQLYNPSTKVWSTGPSLNIAVYEPEAAVFNNILYLAGNTDDGNMVVQRLSSLSGSWDTLIVTDSQIENFCLVATVDTLYFLGGRDFRGLENRILSCGIQSNTCSFIQEVTLATPVSEAAVAIFDTLAYIFGGESDNGITNTIQIFDLNTKLMVPKTYTLLTARKGHTATAIGPTAYIVGGVDEFGRPAPNEVFFFNNDPPIQSSFDDAPTPRVNHGAAAVGTTVYIAGGVQYPDVALDSPELPLEYYSIISD